MGLLLFCVVGLLPRGRQRERADVDQSAPAGLSVWLRAVEGAGPYGRRILQLHSG